MCLAIEKTFKRREDARAFTKKPMIAKKNIYVYKYLEANDEIKISDIDIDGINKEDFWYSPFRGAPYLPGATHQVDKFSFEVTKVYNNWGVNINKGLHSFLTKEDAEKYFNNKYKSKFIGAIVRCYIPKGAQYFKNKFNIVSTQLKIPEFTLTPIEGSKITYKVSKNWQLV